MIYLFDKDEKLIKIVRKSAVKTALQKYALTTERYVSDRLTVELKGLNADELEQVEYMAIQTMEDAHAFHYFYVAQKSSDELTTLIGVQSGIEELRKSPVYDKRPQNAFARDVITDLLAGTNWQARFVGETTPHSTNFYYTSVFDALKKVCEVWDLEMQFFVEMNGNRIGGRYIDFKRRIGEAVGKRVVYGHNALQILQEVERTNIFTALIGRGKGEEVGSGYGRKITFEDVTWSTAQGKPVNKPKGQKYLELPLMTRQYGIKNADGSMRPKIGFVDFSEEENPEILIERTYKALIDAARPQLTLKTSSVYLKGVKIGDTIRVVRHDKKLDYDTRIFEITFNRLNNQSSDIKLGDRIGESNEAKVQTIADKAVEQFINNEFSSFVQNLPNHLPSADGFNNNWYGAEDPTVQYPGKVLINDIWFKPDSEHEGHQIMLRWTGEVWEEILRTYESESLRERIAEEIAQVNQSMQAQSEEHDRQVTDILAKTQFIESLANQAKTDAASAITTALQSKDEAIADARAQVATVSQALNTAKTDLQNIATYQETVDRKLTELTSSTQTLDGKINTASAKVDTVAGQILTELTRVEGKIPTEIGANNLFILSGSTKGIYKSSLHQDVKNLRYAYGPKILIDGQSTYTLQSWSNILNDFSWLGYSQLDSNGVQIPNTYVTIYPARLQKYYRRDIITHNSAKYIQFSFSDDVFGDAPNLKIKFEKGMIATDWSPAPEDINSELSSTKTLITQTAEGQTQLSNRLTTTQDKVSTAETKISQLISDVSSKVSQTDYNTLTGRVDSAETAITQNAQEISKRLTSTQVESAITAKGYQTKAQVDNNITGRGYITNSALQPYALSTTVQNLVQETADSFSRTISETKALIPTEIGGRNYFSKYLSNYNTVGTYAYRELGINPITITVSDNDVNQDITGCFIGVTKNGYNASDGYYWIVKNGHLETNKTTINGFGFLSIYPKTQGTIDKLFKRYNIKVELGTISTDWSPAPEDLATVTALHDVKDTVSSHTRTIGAVGETGSILDNVSKVTQTAAGLVTEVSGTNGLKTQVSTLAGSYAIKNLTNSGTVLNQLNLNKDGSVKIDGKLVQITGTTYIQDGVITSAKIAGLDAGKITTGTLDAARIAVNSIDGSKMVFDQAFVNKMTANEAYLKQIFAKDAFITQVQAVTLSADKISGGILSAMNDAMKMDLNTGSVNFFTDSPAIRRSVANLPNQFVKFATATEANDNSFKVLSNGLKTTGQASVTSIGTNRANGEKVNDGAFTGINIYASGPATGTSVVDRIGIYSDVLIVSHSVSEGQRGWVYENYNSSNNNFALRPLMPRGLSNYSSYIGTETHPITRLYSDDVMLNGHRLKGILKDLANRVGKYDGWAADIS